MRHQRTGSLICGLWLLLLSGCGPLFKVAPRPASPPADAPANAAASATPGGFDVSASALTDDERALELFGANLPLAGLVAVEVRLTNHTAEPIQVDQLKFELRDAAGASYKRLAPKEALKRLMKFYRKSAYLKESYRQTREGFEALALPAASALAPQEERRGFLFFEAKRGAATLSGLILSVAGGRAPITLRLN